MNKRIVIICLIGVVDLLLLFSLIAPSARRNNPNISPQITAVLLEQATIDFDAPLLELIHFPFYRVLNFSGTTGKVAVYSRAGFRIATMTITDCKTQGNTFFCGGDHTEYGLGW